MTTSNNILLNGIVLNPHIDFKESEWCLTSCPVRILLQVRTGEERRAAASSTQGAAHVFGYPYSAMRHVLHLTVTGCECSEQAVSTEAEANMKNPSKAVLLQRERRLLPRFFFFLRGSKSLFLWPGLLSRLLGESQHPGEETERVDGDYRVLTCGIKSFYLYYIKF